MTKPPSPTASAVPLRFEDKPSNWRAMLGSLLARRPAQAPADALNVHFHAVWNGAQADPAALAGYRAVCELPAGPTLPLLYLHAMAMPLHMAILSHPAFPLRLLGLVHWTNKINSLQPVAHDAVLAMECTLNGITATDRGQSFSLHTTVRVGDVDGDVVWREVSTFLSPLAKSKSARSADAARASKARAASDVPEPDWGTPVAQWSVAANVGRRFAKPSGDWNPIHVSAFTARLFGYPRAIAHGLFSAARCLALLEKALPPGQPLMVDLRFKRPLLIPGTVALHTAQEGNSTRFVLKVQPTGEPHIEGVIQQLDQS
jgi:acyl dehydratase